MQLPITPATRVHVGWDDSALKLGRAVEMTPSPSADPADAKVAYLGTFGWKHVEAASESMSSAIDRVTAAAGSSALDGVRNTYRRNGQVARSGEVVVWIDNKGLSEDLRWRGEAASAPQPILDLLAAARELDAAARRGN